MLSAPMGIAADVPSASIVGNWSGALAVGATRLRVVFHIRDGEGGLVGFMDSIDPCAVDMRLSSVTQHGPAVRFGLSRLAARFQGVLDAGGATPAGAWIKALDSGWFRFFLDYDPAPTLARVHCPVLAIAGSKDLQVPPARSLPAIRAALANNADAEIEELPGLNPLFQTAAMGGVHAYGLIEETLAPVALEMISGWIMKHVAGGAHGT